MDDELVAYGWLELYFESYILLSLIGESRNEQRRRSEKSSHWVYYVTIVELDNVIWRVNMCIYVWRKHRSHADRHYVPKKRLL
jgi:hypothetical protein